jgi:hypothetical protein
MSEPASRTTSGPRQLKLVTAGEPTWRYIGLSPLKSATAGVSEEERGSVSQKALIGKAF